VKAQGLPTERLRHPILRVTGLPRRQICCGSLRGNCPDVLRFLVLLLVLPGTLFGAEVKPEIDTQPSSLELSVSGKESPVLVAVRNSSDSVLSNLRLSWLANDRVRVGSAASLQLPKLAPHEEHVWEFTIALAQPGDKIGETLRLRLDYIISLAGEAVPQVVLRPMEVKTREVEPPDRLVDVQVKTTLDSLETSRTGIAYLVIYNKSIQTIMVRSIAPVGKPDFIQLKLSPEFKESKLQPYQTIVQEVQVTANRSVEPGKYLLIFKVTLGSHEGTTWRDSNAIASQEVILGVLGESAILKVLSLPSFFLLPGCLVILTAGLFCRVGWLRRQTRVGDFPLKYNEPDFWLVSITISLFMAIVYWLIVGRWYFVRYGLQDIAIVWFISIVLGVLGYAVWQRIAKWMEDRLTLSTRDGPLDILRKMHRRKTGLVLARVTLAADQTAPAFVLQENDNHLWICPSMRINLGRASTEVQAEIRTQLTAEGDPNRLADLLETSSAGASWNLHPITGVRLVPQTDVAARANQGDMIVEEVV